MGVKAKPSLPLCFSSKLELGGADTTEPELGPELLQKISNDPSRPDLLAACFLGPILAVYLGKNKNSTSFGCADYCQKNCCPVFRKKIKEFLINVLGGNYCLGAFSRE